MGILDRLFGRRGPAADVSTPSKSIGDDAAWQKISSEQRMPCPIELVEESNASGEVSEIYEAVKRALQVPEVPNIDKVLAHSLPALKGTTELLGALYIGSTLPQPVVSMLLYSISLARDCQYCSSLHRLTCRMVGVDEDMLVAIGNDPGSVTPERVQAIVNFGVKAAMSSVDLTRDDFEKLRDMGISDSEIVEIVALAGMGTYLNIIANALKVEVDPMIKQGLAG